MTLCFWVPPTSPANQTALWPGFLLPPPDSLTPFMFHPDRLYFASKSLLQGLHLREPHLRSRCVYLTKMVSKIQNISWVQGIFIGNDKDFWCKWRSEFMSVSTCGGFVMWQLGWAEVYFPQNLFPMCFRLEWAIRHSWEIWTVEEKQQPFSSSHPVAWVSHPGL